VALSTTVTLLVPEEERDKANGLVGTVNGVSFSITSLFSGLSIGQLGMGWTIGIGVVLTAVAAAHLLAIRFDEAPIVHDDDAPAIPAVDVKGALRAVRVVDGLMALLVFSTFNNLLGGAFMALMDPYALMLVSVEAWGILLAVTSSSFILGGVLVATRGLGKNPVRALLVTNVAMWTITILFPLKASIVPVVAGFFVYMLLIPRAEAAEQTVIQRVVPLEEQGRVFGFAQSVEQAASPVTSFLLGPLAQIWVMPFMTTGSGADAIGSWFGTGPDRGIALVFVATGVIGVIVTLLALRSGPYHRLSATYAARREPAPAT
ncbi:MAG: MFS transporter, partial [Acidimicrobiales bacterium]|nr:MFS transporter [Acidimicrobiales bacterium]